MALQSKYRYSVCLFKLDGTSLGELPISVDWVPAAEWCRFLGIRRGLLSADGMITRTVIQPIWHPTAGQPCVSSLQVVVGQEDGRQISCQVPTTYFGMLARHESDNLVTQGVLRSGELFRYLVAAYPERTTEPNNTRAAGRGSLHEISPSIPVKQSCLAEFSRRSVRFGQPDNQGDIPVFLPQDVLDETAALSRKAGALETGGILIGHLYQDSSLPELFVEVTAQVHAQHTRSELTRLTFTAETWSAVSASIKLRKKDELMLGWWHSHSYGKCAEKSDKKGNDNASDGSVFDDTGFLSTEDFTLHRLCFPRSYSIALLVAESQYSGLSWSLYGWNAGMISPRGFQIFPRDHWLADVPIEATIGDDCHAK
jgi:hypothetical protein